MMNGQSDIYEIIHRVLQGVASDEDQRLCREWQAHSRQNRKEFHGLRMLYQEMEPAPDPSEYDFRLGLNRIRARLEARRFRKQSRVISMTAAAIIVAVLVGMTILNESRPVHTMVFNKAKLSDAFSEIGQEFSVTIECTPIEDAELTGTFHARDETEVLSAICDLFGLGWQRRSGSHYRVVPDRQTD